ncbi:MAG: diphosphate--fructose-6-phosphate 1-phosphotransferase [Chloroflexi bacterium]|nr:diphosphate--fructose-6-phosphate 1-phosphotransferase [Chloroflexota bacterium]
MTTRPKGNVLVLQSGGCTPVINRSLFGIAQEAFGHPACGNVYGALHGLEGLLRQELVDLERLSKASWKRIARAPGAALGSTRRRLRPEDVTAVLHTLSRHGVRFLFIIGGNDSAETGHNLSLAASAADYSLTVINVPKTIDNDLVLTDHSPGFGSAARFVALAALGAGRDAEAMGRASPVTIIEVMGRDAGWLAASASLARRDERDAPHIIGVPEVPMEEDRFLSLVEAAYARFGYAVAVIAENVRGVHGVLGSHQEPWFVDDFGHPYYDGPGRYLAGLVSRHLRVRARYEKPGTLQRSFMACVSRTDAQEAEMVGRQAVRYALEGHSDQMVTLIREPGSQYRYGTGLAPLEHVAHQVKTLPDAYFDPSASFVTAAFVTYARPLIGSPLPRLDRIGDVIGESRSPASG